MPNKRKEIYVKISKIYLKLSLPKEASLLPKIIARPWLKKVPIATPK